MRMASWFKLGRGKGFVLAAGVAMQVLGGCDPTVRDTVLAGLQAASTGLATTFIDALFFILGDQGDQTLTTVQAIIEHGGALLA